jgi:hypothetical protein
MPLEIYGQVFEEHDLIRVPKAELDRFDRPGYFIAGKRISELGDEGELRWCDNCERWELLFWATEHVSFDAPVLAFSKLELVTRIES